MKSIEEFLKRKNIIISGKRYGIDALGAMAQGLFCSLLVGTIINTIGMQFHIAALSKTIATIAGTDYSIGSMAMAMSGPVMACAIGYALAAPPLVLFSLITVGFASNALGGAGGPLAVLFVAIFAAECGKAVSKERDILFKNLFLVLKTRYLGARATRINNKQFHNCPSLSFVLVLLSGTTFYLYVFYVRMSMYFNLLIQLQCLHAFTGKKFEFKKNLRQKNINFLLFFT